MNVLSAVVMPRAGWVAARALSVEGRAAERNSEAILDARKLEKQQESREDTVWEGL